MVNPMEELMKMEYPGRAIIIGRMPQSHENVALYLITGRSASSQARVLVSKGDAERVLVEPTDLHVLIEQGGDPELLIYDAIIRNVNGYAISNGVQTQGIDRQMKRFIAAYKSPKYLLERGTADFEYEPDRPNFTPRISGILMDDGSACLGIIKMPGKDDPEGSMVVRESYPFSTEPGKAKMIATYTGVNMNPLPSWQGPPMDVELGIPGKIACDLTDLVKYVYDSLKHKDPVKDFRVGVAGVTVNEHNGERGMAIVNRHKMPSKIGSGHGGSAGGG